ncbi:hypothetical protein ACEZDB_32700 [Streptacidiphilus sp. N1-3]|uniref:Uncharacterized protein n=1 Tax=Streptacidiphilus alkalitolerans TaxID=3342712 RepID=A0ABV6XAY8_9ACTN
MVTEAVADLSTQTHEQGRTPRRGGVHWRYGMGFVVLLASVLSLVLVGQIAGWIQDPHRSAQAGAMADYRASTLQGELRTLPPLSAGGVLEASYASAVRAQNGVLLDVAYPAAAGGAPVGLTVRLSGSATSGVLSGRHLTVVERCYHYTLSATAVAHQQVACPGATVAPAIRTTTSAPSSPPASTSAPGGKDTGPSALIGLASRLNALLPVQREVPADDSGVRQLLAAAEPPAGTPWEAAYPQRSGGGGDIVLAIGQGGAAGCLFAGIHAERLTAWMAPQLAPCTAARASLAVLAGRS